MDRSSSRQHVLVAHTVEFDWMNRTAKMSGTSRNRVLRLLVQAEMRRNPGGTTLDMHAFEDSPTND